MLFPNPRSPSTSNLVPSSLMAVPASGPPILDWGTTSASYNFCWSIETNQSTSETDTKKPISYLHGEPQVIWDQAEINQMIINENLKYAVIGKFSYGWPDIHELRKAIPKQCELKGNARSAYYAIDMFWLGLHYWKIMCTYYQSLHSILMQKVIRFQCERLSGPMFNLKEEATTVVVWISFPPLPPNIFGEEASFSLTSVVGKSYVASWFGYEEPN